MISDPFFNNNNMMMSNNRKRDNFFDDMGGFGMINMNLGGGFSNFNINPNQGVGQSISSTTIIKYYFIIIIIMFIDILF